MADGLLEILAKRKLKEKRSNRSIFSFSFENNSSVKKEAELFSNKTGFSTRNVISSFTDTEVYGWSLDFDAIGDTAGRLAGIVYNESIGKTVVFHLNSAASLCKVYEVDNDNNHLQKTTISLPATFGGARQVIYSTFANKYYIIGNGTSSRVTAVLVDDTSYTTSVQDWTTYTSTTDSFGTKKNSNEVFFIDTFGPEELVVYDTVSTAFTVTGFSNAGTNYGTKVVFDETTNKFFILTMASSIAQIFSVDGTTLAFTTMATYNHRLNGTIELIDNKLFVVGEDENSKGFLEKINITTETIISRVASDRASLSTSSSLFILTDNKNNYYLTDGSHLNGYDVDGRIFFRYDVSTRNSSTIPSSTFNIGGNEMKVESHQFYNSSNDTFSLNGHLSLGSIFVLNPSFTGGLSGFDLPTSANDYAMALTEFNTQPIKISGMIIFYKNGGNSLNNIVKYLEETSTGAAKRKLIQPRNFIDSTSSEDKTIEIEFETPIILDTAHFFKMDVEPNEGITMVLFYSQANASEILENKILG